jgi:hypothetical protein
MRRILTLLMFASFGALLTMIFLPPVPIYRVYTHQPRLMDRRGNRVSNNKYRYVDLEKEPIIGHPSPQYVVQGEGDELQIQLEREFKS